MEKRCVFVFKSSEPERMREDSKNEVHRIVSGDDAQHDQHLVDQEELGAVQSELRTDPLQQRID